MIVDAGPLYAAADADDPRHAQAAALLEGWNGELVVPAFTAAEADHLILSRLGVGVQVAFVRGLGEAFSVESLGPADLAAAAELCERHADLEIGLADASAVVLADRWGTTAIATFDHRRFRVLTPLAGGAFCLLPEDG